MDITERIAKTITEETKVTHASAEDAETFSKTEVNELLKTVREQIGQEIAEKFQTADSKISELRKLFDESQTATAPAAGETETPKEE